MRAPVEVLPVYQISVDGQEIESGGSVWKIAERQRLYLGTYLKLRLEVSGPRTYTLILRIQRESILGKTDSSWLLEAIRAFLQNPPGVEEAELWL